MVSEALRGLMDEMTELELEVPDSGWNTMRLALREGRGRRVGQGSLG